MKINIHFWSYLTQLFFELEMLQTKVVGKIKAQICFQRLPHPPKICAVYAVIWKNILEQSRPQMTVRRMRISCWIPKATNTKSQYVILILFKMILWLDDVPQCYVVCTLPVFLFILNSKSGIENSGENWGLYGDASCYVTEGNTPEWARKVKSGACECHWGNADRHVILWTVETVAEGIKTDA